LKTRDVGSSPAPPSGGWCNWQHGNYEKAVLLHMSWRMFMSNKAYITLMSTNNYLYGCIGLMYSWKNTNPKYPFYCVVTKEITQENIRILEAIGYKIIVDDLYVPESYLKTLKQCENKDENFNDIALGCSTSDFTKNGW
jgi:hypothetical protein